MRDGDWGDGCDDTGDLFGEYRFRGEQSPFLSF